MTEEKNLINMRYCPRFESCSIPKCPLDFYMPERTELPEEEKCVLLKTIGGTRTKRMKGTLTPKMRGLFNFIPNINKKSDKVA